MSIDQTVKAAVFDLGGTLMEFDRMQQSWVSNYKAALESVRDAFSLDLSEAQIAQAEAVLTSYNPRVNYREKEIAPEIIFSDAVKSWSCGVPVGDIISAFFSGLRLVPIIYDYSFELIERYKKQGCFTACMTDLPSAMPDELFRKAVEPLVCRLDLYVSSQSCGFRKPNPHGLRFIAEHFGVGTGQLLYIGNEEKDRQAAVNAGCQFRFIDEVIQSQKLP